ncbi:EAL domain-containing protein [Thalassotalea ganghwensis]
MDLALKSLSVEQGLSQASITQLLQDDEGFIWIGTENGLNLYDGYSFRTLPGPDGDFSNYGIYKLLQDKEGLLWINLNGKGLYTYNKHTDSYQKILLHAPQSKDYYVVDVDEGPEQIIYITTAKTIITYDKTTGALETLVDFSAELEDRRVIHNTLYHQGVLFIGSESGMFAIDVNSKNWKKLPILTQETVINPDGKINEKEANRVYQFYLSPEQLLYFGTNYGIYKIDITNIRNQIDNKLPFEMYQSVIAELPSWTFYGDDSELYIGSYKGLTRVSTENDRIEHLFAFNDVFEYLNNNIVVELIKDKQGVFWLGSNANGVFQWDPSLSIVKNYRYKKSLVGGMSDNLVWSITNDNIDPNKIWVGTSNGVNLVDLSTDNIEQFLVEKDKRVIYTESFIYLAAPDKYQRLWISNAQNIQVFDINTKKLIDLPFSKETNAIFKEENWLFYVDQESFAWVLAESGLNRVNLLNGEVDSLDVIDQTLGDKNIYSLLGLLPNTRKMLLSTNDTLWFYDLESQRAEKIYTHPDILATDFRLMDSFAIDRNNTLWLAIVSEGLVGIDIQTKERKYFIDKKSYDIDPNVYRIFADQEGDIWFSSHNGIYYVNVDSLHVRNFNIGDGFSAREFNGGAATKLADGKLAYGSINGFSIFDPLVLKNKQLDENLKLHATNVEVLSRRLDLPFMRNQGQPLYLNYDDVGIKVAFSPLIFNNQNNMIFEYKLVGRENVTYPETNENYITFPTLASGNYELQARVKSPFTGKYSEPAIVKIYVSYAPWASPAAYVLYAIIIMGFIISWLNKKRRHTQQLIDAHEQVQQREQRLSLALRGSNSEVWDWQAKDNMIFASRAANELGYSSYGDSYRFDDHIKLIHNGDREAFVHQWQEFLRASNLKETFSCTYRMRTHDGQWLWYTDLGKIVETDINGKPTRITGSYTNITQSRADAERAQYYGEAFKQTKDWVFIISDNFNRIIVNQALQDALGWRSDEINFSSQVFGLGKKRREFYQRLFVTLKEDDHWRGEELIQAKTGEEYHVLLNISVNRNKTTNALHFVCIATDITAQKNAEKELRYLANYDHLTELPNRSLLLERIKHAMDYSKRIGQSVALFFIDLDRFKKVNDSLGHDHGDMLLKEITMRLKSVLRVDDTVARIGGDEFVILLESFNGNSQLSKIAQKVIKVVNEPIDLKDNTVSVGASIGIALYPEDANNSDELLKNADVAMYHAKQLGRNTFQFFTPRMNVEASQRLLIESKVKAAHQGKEFINYYQPIVNSSTGKAVGCELLLRWQTEERLVPPNEFIPVAEELNIIIAMTEDAMERGIADLKVWQQYRPDMYLSINLSAQHFGNESLVRKLSLMLEKYQLPAQALKFEITESILISDPKTAIQTMRELADMGIELALDDFGTGYSSLNYLKQLPLHALKIDRSFIKGIGRHKADEAIVDATLVLAKNLDMHCIAEGVETVEQLNYLAKNDCYAIQGYLYSKPTTAAQIAQFLIEDKQEVTASSK